MSGSESTGPAASLLKWSWRGRDERPEGVKGVIAAMFIAAGLGALLLGPQWVFLGPAIIGFTMADYLFGRQYELTEGEARHRVFFSNSSIGWNDVKRVILTEKSLLLSPLEHATWRDSFRGVQLDLMPAIRERALEIVRDRVPAGTAYTES